MRKKLIDCIRHVSGEMRIKVYSYDVIYLILISGIKRVVNNLGK